MANDRKASLLDEAAEIAMGGWHSVEKARAFACAVSDYLACTRDDCTWRSEPNQSGIAREVCDCGAVRSGARVPAATPAAPGESATLSKKDLNKLLNDFARACAFGDDSIARLAASKAIHEYLDAAFGALSNPAPVAAPAKTDADAYCELAEAMGYPGGDACMLSPEEWAADLLRDAKLHRAAPAPASEAVTWECRKRVPNNPTWSEWTSCLERDHVAIQAQSLHWGMVYQSRALCLATPTPGDSADAPVQQVGELTDERLAFEADYLKRFNKPGYLGRREDGAYGHLITQARWESWQVRAALKGEQPAQSEPFNPLDHEQTK